MATSSEPSLDGLCACVFKSHLVATGCFEIGKEEQTLGWVALATLLNCCLLSLKDGFLAFKSLSCLDGHKWESWVGGHSHTHTLLPGHGSILTLA